MSPEAFSTSWRGSWLRVYQLARRTFHRGAAGVLRALAVVSIAVPSLSGPASPRGVAAASEPSPVSWAARPDLNEVLGAPRRFDAEALPAADPPPDLIFADAFESGSF